MRSRLAGPPNQLTKGNFMRSLAVTLLVSTALASSPAIAAVDTAEAEAAAAARQRRSPAMIIHIPVSGTGLTSSGSSTPFCLIELESSDRSPSSVRG